MKMIDNLKEALFPLILKLINNVIKSGIFPSCLKIAKIIPIKKNTDILNPKIFRPVNLLCPLSKLIEKAIKNKYVIFWKIIN